MRHNNDAIEIPGPATEGSGWGRVSRGQLMIETLEDGLSELSGDRVRVRSIRANELGKSTSFAIHRVDVQLESGAVLPVIFKDLNPLRQRGNAKRIRQLELSRSRRELWMYRHVLPGLALGTPQLYGYRWEPKQGNLWLLLENVGQHRLDGQHIADGGFAARLALFVQAAAWAGRFHAATAEMPGDERLLRYDRAHYERRGKHLGAYLERIAEESRPLIERALARHDTMVKLVDGLPHGMIHGEFFGKNVLARRDQSTDAIAVIDWETAGTGPLYVDLVSISAGHWARRERMAMRRAYFDARYSPGADWRRFNEESDIMAILQAVSWLGYWVGSDTSDPRYARHVSRWMRELRTSMGDDVPA
jgi:aminoglycoside/choline kinase family phosphotransferase